MMGTITIPQNAKVNLTVASTIKLFTEVIIEYRDMLE
jgi:hypothetical protein